MNIEVFVFDCPPAEETEYERNSATVSLKIAAKRYTKGSSESHVHGLTLLFTHCIGAHKEQWEPVIDELFDLQQFKDKAHRVREAWSFDWQSHGESAVLNREILKESRPYSVSAYEWAAALAAFVESPRMKGHRVIAIGHSAGAGTIVQSTRYFSNSYPYPSMILVEPSLLPRELFHSRQTEQMAALQLVFASTSARRDRWTSTEQAFDYFKKRLPWSLWDERVLRLYVKHGLQDSYGQEGQYVTLKGDREHEALSYCDAEPAFEAAVLLKSLCSSSPVHLIWGTRNDFVPEYVQKVVADPLEGRQFASVSKIDGAGHMVVQESPDKLALTISEIISGILPDENVLSTSSKL